MSKKKYHENLFCKVFCKLFSMKDLVNELSYGKQDTLTKRFVSYKIKEKVTEGKVRNDLKSAAEVLIEENLQTILDNIQDLDPMVEKIDLNAKALIETVFDITITNKSVQITMEK